MRKLFGIKPKPYELGAIYRCWAWMEKQALRERVWSELEKKGLVTFPKPARGRVPNFVGSDAAARLLRTLPAYKEAKTIMINPDAAQLAVRELALRDGKRLLMASPRLRRGFLLLDPAKIRDPRDAASIRGAFRWGKPVDPRGVKVDLVVEGSVAVDGEGGSEKAVGSATSSGGC